QAEDGIRDRNVTGVQTCALPIFNGQELGEGKAKDDDQSRDYCQNRLAAVLICEDGRNWNTCDKRKDGDQLQLQEVGVWDAQAKVLRRIANTEGKNPRGDQVEQGVAAHHDEGANYHWLASNLEYLSDRCLNLLALVDGILEDRGFLQLQTHV